MAEATRKSETGQESALERTINHYTSTGIHLFLSFLAVAVFIAAICATVIILGHVFPKILQPGDEYKALQIFIHELLLVAIAAELGLLLLFHRTSAAIEVIIFVIARKMVSPDITGQDMLMGAVALSLLIFIRFRFLGSKKAAA